MSRRDRLSSSAYREAALKRAAKALLGSPVARVAYPGGRSRESCLLTLADGRVVVGTRRACRRCSQLLESWPGEPRVLARYRAWLETRDAAERATPSGEGAGASLRAAT